MLQIRLLGQFDVRLDGRRIVIASRAGQSLLAYLALTAGMPHRREKLAGTFWPDTPEENGRKNLRQELWRIRKALSVGPKGAGDYLLADEYTVGFNRNSAYWLDVAQLEKPDLDLESLTRGLSLYQGELLPGFYEDWIVLERERIQSLFDIRMGQLLERLIESERWAAVQEQGERWLALGNTPEPAFRALMLAYGVRGDMAKVSSIYQRCTAELKDQLGVEPSSETRALYEGLIKGSHHAVRPVPQPTGTITFLFTDIEGSTNLLDNLGPEYASVLQTHHEIMRRAILKWNGKEVDTQGDAFFVTFARALDAIQCAAEAQRALLAQQWPQEKSVRVRMGMHTGEPLIASTGYVGMDVHRAARIGDAAHGGQILLSQITRELVEKELPPGLAIRDLGEHRLKDLKYPTPIYQLVIDGLPYDFPAIRTKFSGTEAPTPGEPPFKGLQYFDEADSELFFGRELLTAKLMDRLQETRFLSVIIGASGSGKSSLVRAGLIPALKRAGWQVHVITPTANPLASLAAELTREAKSVIKTARLIDDLMQDPRSLSLFLERKNLRQGTLLVIDQFEELFTLCRDEFERETFIDNLLTAIHQSTDTFTLVLTLRADFYAHLAQYPDLRDAVAKHQEYIGPMSSEELRHAIEEPARLGHWAFEPGLVDLILRDIGDEPGALPLLSHALLETWKRRAGYTLTLKGYADAGGVHGAIAHTAEGVYQSLSAKEQAIARDIFLRLTELGEGTEDTRRRASFEELMSDTGTKGEVRQVLSLLADARLITLGKETAEVAHEALIREWPTLRTWLNEDREGLQLHRRLTEAAREWEFLERDESMLYRGAHLAQAREWAAARPGALNAAERAFLDASDALEQHELAEREAQQRRELEAAQKLADTERRSASRLRTRSRVITTVGAIAIILALLAGMFGIRSNQNEERAETNFNRAEAQRLALEANRLLTAGGSPEQIALLSLRSMNTHYTPEGDAALAASARLDLPQQLFTHSNPILTVALSPEGRYVLTGHLDGIARLWDALTGEKIREFVGHMGPINSSIFSPDGKHILTGSRDTTARLWSVTTAQEIRQFIGHTGTLYGVAFSQDGKVILTFGLGNENTSRLWNSATGREIQKFIGPGAISPDGNFVITAEQDMARLWDIRSNREVLHFAHGHTVGAPSLLFSPDGTLILTGSFDGAARLWDAVTGKVLQSYIVSPAGIDNVAFSPDGKYVFTTCSDGTTRMWDAKTGQELRRFANPVAGESLAISRDGKSILTAGHDGTARLWNVQPRTEFPSFQTGTVIGAVEFSHDGELVLTGDFSGVAILWDTFSGRRIRDFIGHTGAINYGAVFSPDDKYVLTGGWEDGVVRLSDVQSGREIRQFTGHNHTVNSVAFSPDGKYVVAATCCDGAWLWEVETGQNVHQFNPGFGSYRAAFSPDGKYLATSGGDGIARLFDISTGKLVRQFTGPQSVLNSVAFSADGKYLITASAETLARLWDVQTGQEVRQLSGHNDLIFTAVFSPNGRYIATASNDQTARLWDVETGEELRRFVGHTAGVENVAFSPDGKYILTSSDDGTALLWDVDYHTTMDYLCSRLLRDFTEDERAQYGIADDTPTCP